MKRLLPASLQGQMLLAVAAALLVAQTIGAVIAWKAQSERQETADAHALAFRLIGGRMLRGPGDAPPRFNPRHQRLMRLVAVPVSPRQASDKRDSGLEKRLREILAGQGVVAREIEVFRRPIADDRPARTFLERRALRGRHGHPPPEHVTIAAARVGNDHGWLVARNLDQPQQAGNLKWLILQTLLIYIVLVGAIALLLRRITGPLAALTGRVEHFAADPASSVAGQIEPQGPLDTRRLIAAHNRMESRIAALLDEKDVMLGAIGHDLKTPLAALRIRIESVEDEDERARMAGTIEDITHTLDDILSLARVGRPTDSLEPTELSALVAAVVEEFEDMGEPVELGDTIRIVLPLRVTWLRRALRNLIANALRYGSGASVSVYRRDHTAVVRVEDTGPGIPEAEIAKMMEPFARGDPSRNRGTGGAGLGLTLARAIAEQHGGTLSLTNRQDGKTGLIAELALPLA